MAKIAIMGFGTVGSGVLEVCRRNAASIARRAGEPVEVKYILDVRDFSDSPDAALFTKSIDTILNDPEVRVVVETIGGTKFAYVCAAVSGKRPQRLHLQQGDGRYLRRRAACPCQGAQCGVPV